MHLKTSLLAVGMAAVPCLATPILSTPFLARSKYGTEAVAHTFDVAKTNDNSVPHYMENISTDAKHSSIEIHLQARDEAVKTLHSDGSVIGSKPFAFPSSPRPIPTFLPKPMASKGKKLCPKRRAKLSKKFLKVLIAAEKATSKKPLTREKVEQLKKKAKKYVEALRVPPKLDLKNLSKHPANEEGDLEKELFELLVTLKKSDELLDSAQALQLRKISNELMMNMLAEEAQARKKSKADKKDKSEKKNKSEKEGESDKKDEADKKDKSDKKSQARKKHNKRDLDDHKAELERNLVGFLLDISEAEKPIKPEKKIQLQKDFCNLIELLNGAHYSLKNSKHNKRGKNILPEHLEPQNRTQERMVEVAIKALAAFMTPEVPENERVPDADDGPKDLNKRDLEEHAFEEESFDEASFDEVSFDDAYVNDEISSYAGISPEEEAEALAMQMGPSDKHPHSESFKTRPEHFEDEEENFDEASFHEERPEEVGEEESERFETLSTPPWQDSDDVNPGHSSEDLPTPPSDDSEDIENNEEEHIPTPPWADESEDSERPTAPWEFEDVEIDEDSRPIAPWEIEGVDVREESRPIAPWEMNDAEVEEENRPIAPWESEEGSRPTAPWETDDAEHEQTRPIAPWESDNDNVITPLEVTGDTEESENPEERRKMEADLGPYKKQIMEDDIIKDLKLTWNDIMSASKVSKVVHVSNARK
ncbi:hypothetical protein B0T11DRAFT_354793 [Plectosphaerella cucumerina]|uniref:Uncharacterized protein n=1 Tax=Plectosphaerella cucumerina TaxID=40658 RepID=A0A8K0TCN0_9PEZI|nr:hypothetical protein B0T11DRAFT_354793 [Plectosphaerella cucumerina]